MTSKDENPILDEQLANFTDQLLAGNKPSIEEDPELQALTETVQRVHSAFGEESAEEAVFKRVQDRVMASWLVTRPERENLQRRSGLGWWLRTHRQRVALVISLAVIVLLVIITPWLDETIPSIPGTAISVEPGTLVIFGVSVVFIIVLFIGSRRKR